MQGHLINLIIDSESKENIISKDTLERKKLTLSHMLLSGLKKLVVCK